MTNFNYSGIANDSNGTKTPKQMLSLVDKIKGQGKDLEMKNLAQKSLSNTAYVLSGTKELEWSIRWIACGQD